MMSQVGQNRENEATKETIAALNAAVDPISSSIRAHYGRNILLHPSHSELINKQSVPLEGQEFIRRSPRVKDGELLTTKFDDVHTVHDMLLRGLATSKDGNCAGWREEGADSYSWINYLEFYNRVRAFGSGLLCKGAKADKNQFVGIFSQNRVEWLITDHACVGYSMVSVPLYDTFGPEALTHIVNQCELEIVMVDTNERAQKLLTDAKAGNISTIRLLVMVDDLDDVTKSFCGEVEIEAVTFTEIEQQGKEWLKEFVPPKPEDLYTIIYTSGTTGMPKGVMHSHTNAVALVGDALINMDDYHTGLKPSDVLLSYLPLAHVLERYIEYGVIMHGGSIGYFRGEPKLLMDDAATLKPTIFPLVPRLINRIYGKVMAAVSQSGWKKSVFNFFLGRKMAALRRGHVTNDTIWDKLLFHRFQALIGGRVKISVTGAAPISAEVLNVVRCVLGIPILEAYGLTESGGAFTCTLHGDFEGGNVGSVMPGTYVKLVDVPEKEYYAKDNKGEVCCKGLTVCMGYYKDEAKTKEIIDEDGWLHTGDIGQWLPNGALKIIDRKKNIFKLSQGEYIAPEKIEQIYSMSEAVFQVYVHGESLKSCIIGVVVPDEEILANWCKERGIEVGEKSFEDLCQSKEVNALIFEDINNIGRHRGLKSFEMVKKIYLCSEQFTIQNDMITPTLKTRRPQVYKRHQSEIDRMYADFD